MYNGEVNSTTDKLVSQLLDALSELQAKVHVTLEVQVAIMAKLNGTDLDEEREVVMTDVDELKKYYLSSIRQGLSGPISAASDQAAADVPGSQQGI